MRSPDKFASGSLGHFFFFFCGVPHIQCGFSSLNGASWFLWTLHV